jgi:hypothetical protein
VSDSILYLGIVAIWAGFLIPAWVRRPHATKTELDSDTAFESESASAEAEAVAADPPAGHGAHEYDADSRDKVSSDDSEYRNYVHMHDYGPTRSRSGGGSVAGRSVPKASQSREQMMRARRRMLTILTALVVITAGFVTAGFVQWWICVPPVAMLVLYVLLLREIAMADAELARKRAAWEARAAEARAARDLWRQAHQAWQARAQAPGEPTAEIIDISGRVGDQLYDQYADAAVRAVGD